MESAIFIKKLKKYEKYNLSIDRGMKNVLLTGKTPILDEEHVEINPYYLVQATRKLGKELYSIILEELKKRTLDINNALKSNIPGDKTFIDKNIKDYINAFNNTKNKNYSHYKAAFELYSEAYRLLKNENIKNVNVTNDPKLISLQLNELENDRYWGINFDESISGQNIKHAYEEVFRKIINNIDNTDNTDNIDYTSLLDKIDYMLYDIKYLFNEIFIIREEKENEQAHKIFDAINQWCEKFGMPFWNDQKKIAEQIMDKITFTDEIIDDFLKDDDSEKTKSNDESYSQYEWAENTVPIINLISISLSIYLFDEKWKNYIKKEEIAKDKKKKKSRKDTQGLQRIRDKEKELENVLSMIGISSIYDISDDFVTKADYYHNYIMNNFNSIGHLKLNNYEKKIPYEKDNITLFYNAREYESTAIAAWDVFYHDYLGNLGVTKSLPYCDECHKQIPKGQAHTIETRAILCDECYKSRKEEKNRQRVRKYREKKQRKNKKS